MVQDRQLTPAGDSTNDIAHLLGMLDPWYERNTLSLLNLPANIVCQVQVWLIHSTEVRSCSDPQSFAMFSSKPQRRSRSHMTILMSIVSPFWLTWSCITAAMLPVQR